MRVLFTLVNTGKNTRNSFWNIFPKKISPFKCSSLSLVVILYTAHATQFPSTQAVRFQLLVLLTLNFFCCKPLTVCEKKNLFSSSRSYFFTFSISYQKAVFPGAGYEGITEYKSVIYYQVKQPCWNETVKVQTPSKTSGYVFEVLKLKSLSYDSRQHSLTQSINLQHSLALFCVQVKRCDL